MNRSSSSVQPSIPGLRASLDATSLHGAIDIKHMSVACPLSPPTNLTPMDITPGSQCESPGYSDAPMNTSPDLESSNPSPPDSTFSSAPTAATSTSSGQQSVSSAPAASSVLFPKPAAQFTSHILPPTPPTATTADNSSATSNDTSTSRLSRPPLTSRLSSRSGGKRHASIGSARELPFPAHPSQSTSGATATDLASSTPSLNHIAHAHASSVDNPTPGWNARLREMGLHIPGIGSPKTPRTPRSNSMSSGAATPKSPEEQRAGSYFSFRRRGSSAAVSPGKARSSAATPPPPPAPPPAPSQCHAPENVTRQPLKDKTKDSMPSPIAEETTPPIGPKRNRANLSLDLSTTLASRGSTASLPLVGYTPVEHLVQGEAKPRRASMVAPIAPPPHVHTPPVHPPAYEYPFLPHHPPRQPLEVRVEENAPGPGGGDAGSWIISVRLPGFHPDGITVGTRRGRVLMIVADNYNDDDGAGHFERRISFGYDADMAAIRAEFNGDLLRVTVPRRWMFGPPMMFPRNTTISGGSNSTRPTVENPEECRK